MKTEERLSRYVVDAAYEELPASTIAHTKQLTLAILGAAIAGARAEGCEAVVEQMRHWGGKPEATIWMYGGKVPAHNAALANSTMARALDFCDGMIPGMHVGSSSVATALAAAELVGGCSGKEFLTAYVTGTEVASRLNTVSVYDGFDPTGICGIFAPTAVACRILRLDAPQTLDALALAFNKAAGSMQSNIDGSLAVRVIQGFTSQSGMMCAQLAQRGITGPKNFIEGLYGYFHLFARDKRDTEPVLGGLGARFEMENNMVKKRPSCGGTLAPTDAILALIYKESISAEQVERVDVTVSPHAYKLVGAAFELGDNPKVNAQFNIRYCVANALLRKSSKLRHFDVADIMDPRIMELTKIVYVTPDNALDDPEHCKFSIGATVKVTMKSGQKFEKAVDAPRGHPQNPMNENEHLERFKDCLEYAGSAFPAENAEKIVSMVGHLENMKDVRDLIPVMMMH